MDGEKELESNNFTAMCFIGEWEDVNIECVLQECKTPLIIPNAYIVSNKTFPGENAFYSCVRGFVISLENSQMVYSKSTTLSPSGRTSPSDSTVTSSYRLAVKCLDNGSWSEDFGGECVPVDCGIPIKENQTEIHYTNTSYQSVANYSCSKGFNDTDKTYVLKTCDASGKWTSNSDDLHCKPIDCGEPPDIPRSNKTFSTTVFLSPVDYTCDQYFVLSNIKLVFCNTSGKWQDVDKLSCVAPNCLKVPEFDNATLIQYDKDPAGYFAKFKKDWPDQDSNPRYPLQH